MRDHTSLHAWQEAHTTAIGVIRLCRSGWKPYASALFSQLQRASLSVQLNSAEGYTFGESPTFTRHLGIAYGSAVETGELLRFCIDAEIVNAELILPLLKMGSTHRTPASGDAETVQEVSEVAGPLHRLPFTVYALSSRLFLSTSTRSCPQAALMSRPLLRRTAASIP